MSFQYRYYDSPDGVDFFKKEYYLLRKALPFGLYLAAFDVLAHTKPVGVFCCVQRFLQVFPRPLMMVTMWNSTTYLSCHIRGLDDGINHAIGIAPVMWYMSKYIPWMGVVMYSIPFATILWGTKTFKLMYPNLNVVGEVTTYRDNKDNTLFADFYNDIWTWGRLAIKPTNWLTLEDAVKQGVVSSSQEAKEKKLTNYKSDGQARSMFRVADGTEYDSLI